MMIANKVNVMGQEYQIIKVNHDQYKTCVGADGWNDLYGKKIYYVDPETDPDNDPIVTSPEELVKQVLKHEIVHAFLVESGLAFSSHSTVGAWAMNEEMVDWFAIQSPKIFKVFQELDIL